MKHETIENINDPWRRAILEERNYGSEHNSHLADVLDGHLLEIGTDNCLVMGDASQMVTSALVEKKGFKHAVIVDNSPTLLDEFKIKKEDSRYERHKMDFHDYHAPENSFNFIYGKSIAFVRKDAIEGLLKNLHKALVPTGVFVGVYAAEGDIFRPHYYSQEELAVLHTQAGFSRMSFSKHEHEGILRKDKKSHIIRVVAYK